MTSSPLFLGVDLGTSSIKQGLYDLSGRQHASSRVAYPAHERDGTEEHHAVDWWRALIEGVRRATATVDRERIAGIAVGGHAPSPVFVDEDFQPLFPVMPWFDQRATGERERLAALCGEPPVNGPQRLMAELAARAMWHRTHLPGTFSRVRWILHSSDYLLGRLTGLCVSTATKVPGLFTAASLSPGLLPDRVCAPGDFVGTVRREIADELGLPPGAPAIAGGLDSFLAAIGSGLSETGDACLNSGSATVVALMGRPGREGRFEWNGLPIMSQPVSPGGRTLDHARREWALGPSAPDTVRDAARLAPPCQTEQQDDAPIQRYRRLLDEVLLSQRMVLERLERCEPARRLRGVGGLAASPEFGQLQADVLGRQIDAMEVTESGSLGAAMLAATSLGFHTPASAASHMVRAGRTYEPRKDVAAFYEHQFESDR